MLRILAAALCLSLTVPALASPQQEKMKACNKDAGDLKGAERKAFMSKCLKGDAAKDEKQLTPQQQKMKDCNEQAKGKKGAERKTFMSECLKAK